MDRMHKLAYLIIICATCVFGAGVRVDTINSAMDTVVVLKPIKGSFKGDLSGTADSAIAAKISDSTKRIPDTINKKLVIKNWLHSDTVTTTELYNSGIYGEIHGHDTTHSQSIATGTTYVLLTSFISTGPSRLITCDTANDKLTILRAGKYRVGLTMSFGGSANSTWRVACFLNNAEQDAIHFARKLGAGGDVGSASATGIINVTSVPWDLDVRARHDQGVDQTINVWYCNLNISYVGE